MTKKGRITNVEKFAIQGALSEGKNSEEIASLLDRPVGAVDKYVEELNHTLETVSRVQAEDKSQKDRFAVPEEDEVYSEAEEESTPNLEKQVAEQQVASRTVISQVFRQLRQAGLTENDSNQVIRTALKGALKSGKKFDNPAVLFTECVKSMSAGHFIQKTTESGSEGVAIMSSAASQRTDEARKKVAGKSRSSRGAVYRPQSGEIE